LPAGVISELNKCTYWVRREGSTGSLLDKQAISATLAIAAA